MTSSNLKQQVNPNSDSDPSGDEILRRRVQTGGTLNVQTTKSKLTVTNPDEPQKSDSYSDEAGHFDRKINFDDPKEFTRYKQDLDFRGQSIPLYRVNKAYMDDDHFITKFWLRLRAHNPNKDMEARARAVIPRKMEEFVVNGKAHGFARAVIV
ncbi:MAG: hypothetical protein Q9162_006351 [Coniocarpon cinnabarinum]